MHDRDGGTTFCPDCASRLIERDWHEILRYNLTADGRCRHLRRADPGPIRAFDVPVGTPARAVRIHVGA